MIRVDNIKRLDDEKYDGDQRYNYADTGNLFSTTTIAAAEGRAAVASVTAITAAATAKQPAHFLL